MKFLASASSILFLSCFFLLTGCDSLRLPQIFEHDEVPVEIKAAPRLVETPPPSTGDEEWPRLGDVPAKPKDFSAKPVYERHMNELESDRADAERIKKEALQNDPTLGDVAPQNMRSPAGLQPPRFLK